MTEKTAKKYHEAYELRFKVEKLKAEIKTLKENANSIHKPR